MLATSALAIAVVAGPALGANTSTASTSRAGALSGRVGASPAACPRTARRICRAIDRHVEIFKMPWARRGDAPWTTLPTIAPNGDLWFISSDQLTGRQTLVTAPSVGRFVRYATLPVSDVQGLAIAADGTPWFIGYRDSDASRHLMRVMPDGRVVDVLEGPGQNGYMDGLKLGPDGALWFREDSGGLNDPRPQFVRVAPDGMIERFDAPRVDIPAFVFGPDGAIWFIESVGSGLSGCSPRQMPLGRMTIDGASTTETSSTFRSGGWLFVAYGKVGLDETCPDDVAFAALDGTVSRVRTRGLNDGGYAVDPHGRLWFAGGTAIGRIDSNGSTQRASLRFGRTKDHQPRELGTGLVAARDGSLWMPVFGTGDLFSLARYRP